MHFCIIVQNQDSLGKITSKKNANSESAVSAIRMNMESDDTTFDEQVFHDLVAAFYRRVRKDDLIGPMYPENDWEGSEQRLRDFLIYRFGGSDRYIQERGHPRLRMRHAPFKIGIKERDRWLEIMNAAMEETDVPGSIALDLKVFFEQVADFMRNAEE
jgi:hemoglobin